MTIVDSQIHVWAAGRSPDVRSTHRSASPSTEELLTAMKSARVDRAILVPPSWEGDRNDTALAAAARYPDHFAVMGRFPLNEPATAAQLREWQRRTGVLGARLTLHRPPWREWFREGRLDWFWDVAEQAGIPVMGYAPTTVRQFDSVAGRHPELRLIMDHLAIPEHARGDAAFTELDDLLELARHPNVAVKASALSCHAASPYPFPELYQHIRRVFDAFGPHRMFWGSDYTRLPCTYGQAVTHFTEELDFLSAEDLTWIMGRALLQWLDWPR